MTGLAHDRLRRVERVTRVALGLLWIYQGLVPKLLAASALEHEIVRRTGLYAGSPATTMAAIGVLEIALGLWLVAGIRRREAVFSTSLLLGVLTVVVVVEEPSLLVGPFGGIAKNALLLVAGWTVWVLNDRGS